MTTEPQTRVTKLALKLIEIGGPAYMIAARAGMPGSRLSEYRLGRRTIPPHHLLALGRVLKCDPQDLVGYANQEGIRVVDRCRK